MSCENRLLIMLNNRRCIPRAARLTQTWVTGANGSMLKFRIRDTTMQFVAGIQGIPSNSDVFTTI